MEFVGSDPMRDPIINIACRLQQRLLPFRGIHPWLDGFPSSYIAGCDLED
jgi:hypothetical protein